MFKWVRLQGVKILFVGDVFGRVGRKILAEQLPALAARADFVIVNGENSAGGFGMHFDAAQQIYAAGADCITLGNHAWDHRDIFKLLETPARFPIVRPLNYTQKAPGVGWRTFDVGEERLTVVNLLGRVFMNPVANPFVAMDELLQQGDLGSVFVDFHAEATSEKAAMGWHLDGRVAAVVGTHTHIPTADECILPQGTAFQTDVGFTGPLHSVIGAGVKEVVEASLSERKVRFCAAEGPGVLNAILMDISGNRCLEVQRIRIVQDES